MSGKSFFHLVLTLSYVQLLIFKHSAAYIVLLVFQDSRSFTFIFLLLCLFLMVFDVENNKYKLQFYNCRVILNCVITL